MILRLTCYGGTFALSAGAAYALQLQYRYEDYKELLTLLSGVSGMVFTIMGIWIALLYPNAISRIASPEVVVPADFSESRADSKRLESIVGAIIASALVMVLALLASLAKLAFFSTAIYADFRLPLKACAFGFLLLLVVIQLESVFKVVISNIMFINDLHYRRQSREEEL